MAWDEPLLKSENRSGSSVCIIVPFLVGLFIEIDEAIKRIERRCAEINSPDDFTRNDNGLDRLDGISMMLISISETRKSRQLHTFA